MFMAVSLISIMLQNFHFLTILWHNLRLIQTHSDSFRLIQIYSDSFRLIQTHSNLFRLIQSHSDLFRLIQVHWASLSLIEPHWDSWRHIRRILRKMTLLARMRLMRMMKSHFLKRCSLSERLTKIERFTWSWGLLFRFIDVICFSIRAIFTFSLRYMFQNVDGR